MNKLCISIRSLKRTEYLEQCLASLEANTDLEGVDFLFIQDGAVNPHSGNRYATQKEVEASLKVFRNSNLPNKSVFVKEYNTGTSIHKELQMDIIFPKYEYAILADNDLIFGRYYIKTVKTLFEQFKNSPAGMIQTSFKHTGYNFQKGKEAKQLEDKANVQADNIMSKAQAEVYKLK